MKHRHGLCFCRIPPAGKEDILSHYNPKSPYKVPTYYSTKDDALKAFLRRKDPNGMNLSKRVWNLTPEYRAAIEDAISVALKKGQGPVALSHKVVRYLRDYDKLNADYKRRFGTARKAKDCHYAAYRLAYTEINMAYRTAEQERWRAIDDIVGYEVKTRESSHKDADVCDVLQGKYPKTFKWVGWHPMCHCYAVPIFRSDDETAQGSKAEVRDVPDNYREWVKRNAEGIERARGRGTLPYFLKDNAATWSEAVREARYDREVELIRGVLRGANASLPVGKKGVGTLAGRGGIDSGQAKKEAEGALRDNEYRKKYELAKLSSEQQENIKNIQRALGLKIQEPKPMRFVDADSGSANTSKADDVCVNSVYAFEARRRGLNVTANSQFNEFLAEHPYNGWVKNGKIPQCNIVKIKSDASDEEQEKLLRATLKELTFGKGGRYSIAYNNKPENGQGSDGHIFFAERVSEENLVLYDPLNDSYPSLSLVLKKMDKSHGLELLRIDKLLINEDLCHSLLSPSH